MVTIYELLEVEENASKEEIEKAYSKLIFEFRQDPSFDDEKNKENEMITNKLKIAYGILTNDAKRKKYDNDLAQKRAESLIAGVVIKEEEKKEEANVLENSNMMTTQKNEVQNKIESQNKIEQERKEVKNPQINQAINGNSEHSKKENLNQNILSEKEKNEIRKAAKKEFNQNLKKVKQAEAEYNEAYNKAYNDYLRKMGYKVNEPWTFKRVKSVIITLLIIIIFCIILWNIPPVRQIIIDTYNNNFIIKALVDLVKIIFKAIAGIFKA